MKIQVTITGWYHISPSIMENYEADGVDEDEIIECETDEIKSGGMSISELEDLKFNLQIKY